MDCGEEAAAAGVFDVDDLKEFHSAASPVAVVLELLWVVS